MAQNDEIELLVAYDFQMSYLSIWQLPVLEAENIISKPFVRFFSHLNDKGSKIKKKLSPFLKCKANKEAYRMNQKFINYLLDPQLSITCERYL